MKPELEDKIDNTISWLSKASIIVSCSCIVVVVVIKLICSK